MLYIHLILLALDKQHQTIMLIKKFNKDIDFNDKKLENIKFAKVNYQPTIDCHPTPKTNVDNAVDKMSLVKHITDKDFNKKN